MFRFLLHRTVRERERDTGHTSRDPQALGLFIRTYSTSICYNIFCSWQGVALGGWPYMQREWSPSYFPSLSAGAVLQNTQAVLRNAQTRAIPMHLESQRGRARRIHVASIWTCFAVRHQYLIYLVRRFDDKSFRISSLFCKLSRELAKHPNVVPVFDGVPKVTQTKPVQADHTQI